MTISREKAKEYADFLSDDLSCEDGRQRILCVIEILRTLTDSEHALSNAEIRSVLQARFGEQYAPAENTIAGDLHAIASSGCFDLEVHTTPAGTWCESKSLEPKKVRLLLNAVQASRFLTTEQSADLQESLFGLVSRHQEEALEGQVLVDQRTRKSYQAVFDTCDIIERAIRAGRKIEFEYAYNDYDGKPIALEADAGGTLRVETPIALIFSENNYYLESYSAVPWRHGSKVMRSRVDRMYKVSVSSRRADNNDEVREAKRTAERRLQESFDMVDGTSRTVFLRVRADCTNVMFDRFGFGLKFAQFSGKRGDVCATAVTCVRLNEAFTFYRWLSSAGDGIVMVCPASEVDMRTGPWSEMLCDIDYETVAEDYRRLKAGYLDYLAKARSAYE